MTIINFFTVRRPAESRQINELISVLIPVRNEVENITELLQTLTAQSNLDSIEIIFIDDVG